MATGHGINTDILSDETFDLLCTMCKRKGRNREAKKFYVDCHDYYCFACVKVHKDVPVLSGHKVLDKGQFPSVSSQTSSVTLTERCEQHSHKHVDMSCENHSDVGCSTCMAVDHRLCQTTIPEYTQTLNYTTLGDIEHPLDSTENTLTDKQKLLQDEKQRLLNRKAELRKDVIMFGKKVNDRLDNLEKISLDEIERQYATLIGAIEERLEKLKSDSAHLKSARKNIVSSNKIVSQTFANTRGKPIADKAEIWEGVFEFSEDQRLTELLAAMNSLGRITQKAIRNCEPSSAGTHTQDTLLQIIVKKAYSIKTRSDKVQCCIVSACAMEDGAIILSDCDNKTLKRLHGSTYTVTHCLELSSVPWQVCPITRLEIAACVPKEKKLHVISFGSRMTKTKGIKTDFYCYAVAYDNGNLYISDDSTSVYVYSVSGRKLKQLGKDPALFSDIRSLAVSVDGSKIYVADWENGLIVLDSNGEMVRQYNGTELKSASSCCITTRGNLLICGYGSYNVLQFEPDGKLLAEVLLSDMTAHNQTVCCNQQMSKMIVNGYRNDIEVYDLK